MAVPMGCCLARTLFHARRPTVCHSQHEASWDTMRARPASMEHHISLPGLLSHSSTHRAGVGGHEGQDPGLGAAGPPEAVRQIPTRAPLPAAVAYWPPLLFLPHRSIPQASAFLITQLLPTCVSGPNCSFYKS